MLSIRDCKDLLKYYHISEPPNLRKLKEITMDLYQSKIYKNSLPCFYLCRRQSKNFRM